MTAIALRIYGKSFCRGTPWIVTRVCYKTSGFQMKRIRLARARCQVRGIGIHRVSLSIFYAMSALADDGIKCLINSTKADQKLDSWPRMRYIFCRLKLAKTPYK